MSSIRSTTQAIDTAFSNLASLFRPPSGQELAGYANAAATRADARRRAELYAAAQNPETAWDILDRLSFGAGLQNGGQTLQAVDRNNARALQERGMMESGMDRRNAADNERALATNRLDNQRSIIADLFGPLNQGQTAPAVPAQIADIFSLPEIGERRGDPKPLSETELKAAILADMPVEQQQAVAFGSTPIESIIMGDGPVNVTRPQALGQIPAPTGAGAEFKAPDNYLVMNDQGETVPALGHTDPRTGRIMTPAGEDITDRVVRRVGASDGGMALEVDGQGGVRLTTGGAGGTVSNTTNLLASERENRRVANELSSLYDTISAADVGVAGNVNQLLTDYGAQLFPGVARGDVAAMRSQLEGMSIQLARTLSGDSRISNMDREAAQRVMVDRGLGESLPGAKAKLATLVVLHAYRSAFASDQLEGQQLPPINGQILGQLVDRNLVSPAVAQEFNQTVLSRRDGRPVQTIGTPETDRMMHEATDTAPADPQSGEPVRITSDEEYEALPAGSTYIGPDGMARRKR